MGLKINGSTDGSIEVDVPASCGSDLSVTLPATAGEIVVANTSGDVDLGGLTVSGSAADDSVNVDSSGRLLVGKSSDVNASTLCVQGRSDGSTEDPIVRIDRDATPADGQGLGNIFFGTSADTSNSRGGQISAVRDGGTWTANSSLPTRITFGTAANGASSPTERMRIDSFGNKNFTSDFGTIPGVNRSGTSIWGSNGSLAGERGTGGKYFIFYHFQTASEIGSIENLNGTSVRYNTSSDYRLKENIVSIDGAFDRIKQLMPRRFNFINDAEFTIDGFIAHEVQDVVPEAVSGKKDGIKVWLEDEDLPENVSIGDPKLDEDGNTIPEYQGIDQSKLVPLLTAALQEAIAKIETLEAKVAALEANP